MRRLVDEAAHRLVAEGPAALSLRKLAASVGVSTMPVYTLFGDKHGLLAAMYEEGFRRLGDALRAVPATDDPLGDLTELGLAYRRAALAGRHLYGLMFGQPIPEFSPDESGQAAAEAAYRPLVDGVIRCQEAGIIIPADPERIALHLWAVTHGMVSLELNGQLPDSGAVPEAFGDALIYAGTPFISPTFIENMAQQ